MKNIFSNFKWSLFTFLMIVGCATLSAQRPMEKLDRSVVAQKVNGGVYVNWRITADEWSNTSYKLYRNGALIYQTLSTEASNYTDPSGNVSSKYTVSSVKNGVESAQSLAASVLTTPYLEIPMRDLKSLGKNGYYLNDATSADLDGDGQMEVIIKRMRRDWTEACTDYTYFEAYKLDGTFLWAIDVGPNITMDVEINIAAFDFDGDGKAEVFMRSSDNTVFGLDKNNQNGISAGDRNADGVTNYRYSIGGDGFMNAAPEYLSLIDGTTGKELDWTNFIPRGVSDDWGDGYGHRANKFFFGAPYLDGKHPSLFTGRGIYTMTKMQTFDVVNKKLVKRWYWECTSPSILQQGKYDATPKSYFGQGYHNYTIADVDGDGCDEINWGSMTIDNDGKPLYSTELGHGDAQHYGDFDPYRKGTEVFACNETKPGTNLRDAKTGQILYRHITPSDCGRAGAGNISDAFKGVEVWGGGVGLSATDRADMPSFGVAESNCLYWDGDLLQEMCDHTGFSTSTGVGYGHITKFNGYGNVSSLLVADAYSCNYTKGTPCLQADIMGDWREEVIWWRPDSMALRVYTSPYPTTNRIYTLLHDHQYRQAICWQMCGYNQPPHVSFYLGSDFPTPLPPKATNGKLVWNGTTTNWDLTSANWYSGDSAKAVLSGNNTMIPFANGKSVLFDIHSTATTVNLPANLSPEAVTVSGTVNYTIGGAGSLTGTMRLDKMGEGVLTLNGNHTYSGPTEVWEGDLNLNGSLTASPVTVRRHSNFSAKGTLNAGVKTEYNASLAIGTAGVNDTLTMRGTLRLVKGARLVIDLSDNPETRTNSTGVTSTKKNDYLNLLGQMTVEAGSIIKVNMIADSLAQGRYRLATVDTLVGSVSSLKLEGTLGVATELVYDATSKGLYLVIKGVRKATTIVWTGSSNSNWDLAKTANFDNQGEADIFVSSDSVLVTSDAVSKTINVAETLPVSYLEVNTPDDVVIGGDGALSGAMTLHKTNSGTLTINNRNAYTGRTIVDGGALILKYIPSATNNGGIGSNTVTDPTYLQLRDSAILEISTANEIGSRSMQVYGANGGLLNVSSALYWNGNIQGTKLTKYGSATLYIGNDNSLLNETVLKAGTIKLNSTNSVLTGVGKKITMMGGTLETLNSTGAYLTSNNNFDVPTGCSSTVIAGARCEYNGALTGAGTLNWYCDYIRAYMNGNWSAFAGTLNIVANGANSTYENRFIYNNGNGMPLATVNLGNGIFMCYKNGTADNGTTTIKIGMLTGVAGSIYNYAGLEVGAINTSGTFGGVIQGASTVKKVGTGTWTLSGANTYTGTTTVSAGQMTVAGSITGTGAIAVANGATLQVSGSVAGQTTVAAGGTLLMSGTVNAKVTNSGDIRGTGTITGATTTTSGSAIYPGNLVTGSLTFKNDVTLGAGSTLNMQIVGGTAGVCDKLLIDSVLTCNGSLNVSTYALTLANGTLYKLFTAKKIVGKFASITLPTLDPTMAWDTTALYTNGVLKITSSTGVNEITLKTGVLKNPTQGLFQIITSESASNVNAVVSNAKGQVVFNAKVVPFGGMFEIDLTTQPKGVYFLKVAADEGVSDLIKLIKE